jgi:hypothetical protein
MATRNQIISALAILIIMACCPDSPAGQAKMDGQQGSQAVRILEFLRPGGEMRKYKATFAGRFIPIPEDLTQDLSSFFPAHRFYIAVMKRSLDISYMESELILVTDAESGEVVSYMWEMGIADPPQSFKQLLSKYPAQWYEEALIRVKTLAELILYPNRKQQRVLSIGGRVGSISDDGTGTISAQLIRKYNPYWILKVRLDEQHRFGPISFIDAETGKEIGH